MINEHIEYFGTLWRIFRQSRRHWLHDVAGSSLPEQGVGSVVVSSF